MWWIAWIAVLRKITRVTGKRNADCIVLEALHGTAHSPKPSITAVQQQRGQTVGVTQKEHRRISLPQMPPGSYGWLEWMEPKDLNNSILVSLYWVSSLALLLFMFLYCLFIQLTNQLGLTKLSLFTPPHGNQWNPTLRDSKWRPCLWQPYSMGHG